MLNRSAAVNWYYIVRGQKLGPLTEAQLDELAGSGQLSPDSLVWREGMAEWKPYGRVRSGSAAVVPGPATGRMSCALCSKSFAPDEVIAFESAWVCAACKPLLVQRVREGLSVGHGSGNAWRDGNLVVTISGSTLTGRCVKCNGVENLSHTSSALRWHPRWVYLLLLLTPITYWVGLLATQRSAWVAISVCSQHRRHRGTLTAAGWLCVVLSVGLAAAAAYFPSLVIMVGVGVVLAGGAMMFNRQWNPLSAAKIEGNYVWLRGCGRAFVDALPEFNVQRAMEQQESTEPQRRNP